MSDFLYIDQKTRTNVEKTSQANISKDLFENYRIDRSLRFNSADTAYLTYTPAVDGDRYTWTWSGWIKRTKTGVADYILHGVGAASTGFLFTTSDNLYLYNYAGAYYPPSLVTNQVFRDSSSWYHIVLVYDANNATASNRQRIYVNGQRITSFSTESYTTDSAYGINRSGYPMTLGLSSGNFDGYMAEVNFIDGQALTPSSFGFFDNQRDFTWKPKKYSGSYGNNGFYLNFSNNSSASLLGKDFSGNGNNWTPNNFSVTAGAGNDSLVDSPTNYGTDTGVGGEVRGNYATLNPLDTASGLSDGNLRYTGQGSSRNANFLVTSGKWYFEGTVVSIGGGTERMSIFYSNLEYRNTGQKTVSGVVSNYGSSFTTNDIIGVAINWENTTATFYKNGVSQGALSFTSDTLGYISFYAFNTSDIWALNFGQRPFVYTAPTGFKALCTTNLPTPTIKKPSLYFDAVTYTGNGAASQDITSLSFSPDLVWLKSRTDAYDHRLKDSTRGNSVLFSNLTNAESAYSLNFLSNGIRPTLGYNDNISSKQYVAWAWDEAPIAGMDIVSYTGNGANRTIGHNLGVVPKMIFCKNRIQAIAGGDDTHWCVYHSSVGSGSALFLNLTNAATANTAFWNNTNPTSSVFSIGTSNRNNYNGDNHIAYLFAEVEGFSKFGSYTGNGSADGPFVYCGFRPRWVMIKKSSASGTNWVIDDTARGLINYSSTIDPLLYPNQNIAESNGNIDILSNGFKIRYTDGDYNASGATYIFAAFAESPFKNARAR